MNPFSCLVPNILKYYGLRFPFTFRLTQIFIETPLVYQIEIVTMKISSKYCLETTWKPQILSYLAIEGDKKFITWKIKS